MKKKHEDLVAKLERYEENFQRMMLVADKDFIQQVIKALQEEQDRFCVFEHLKSGGKCIDRHGTVIQMSKVGNVERLDGNNFYVEACSLFDFDGDFDWKPYEEPLEDGWYWTDYPAAPLYYRSGKWFTNSSRLVGPVAGNPQVKRDKDGNPTKIEEPNND